MSLSDELAAFLARRALEHVTRRDPKGAELDSERRALSVFRSAARHVPVYRALLEEHRVDPRRVLTIHDFRRVVPLTSKELLFQSHELPRLCMNGQLGAVTLAFTSGGYSGTYSFGLERRGEARFLTRWLDTLLDVHFGVRARRTLLLNVLPGSVRVPSSTTLISEVGARLEPALAVLRHLGEHVEQIVVIGEPPLLKRILERAVEERLRACRRPIHVVVGGEFVAEGFRAYVGGLLGHDEARPENGHVVTSFGVSEIALSLAHETADLRRLRRAFQEDRALCEAVLGPCDFVPSLLHYIPELHHLESVPIEGRPRLVVTTLDPRRPIPLVRYTTGDWADVLGADELARRLERLGRSDLLPRWRLPILVARGRGHGLEVSGRLVYPEQVKEALFADPEVAATATSRFRMECEAGELLVHAELEPGKSARSDMTVRFERALGRVSGVPARVCWEERREPEVGRHEAKARYF